MSRLTHFDPQGNPKMVDVSAKKLTQRLATATGSVYLQPDTLLRIQQGNLEKGDVLNVARLAGIMAAKRTPDLIPLCHTLSLSSITVDFHLDTQRNAIDITATCKLTHQTGAEMEALTAVSIAALTIYDMCKSIDKNISIGAIRILVKEGGKSGRYQRDPKLDHDLDYLQHNTPPYKTEPKQYSKTPKKYRKQTLAYRERPKNHKKRPKKQQKTLKTTRTTKKRKTSTSS